MKRFVKILLLPMALLLGHTLIYSSGELEYVEYSPYSDESFYDVPLQDCRTNASYGETMTAYKLDSKNLKSGDKHQESTGHILPVNHFKRLKTTVTGNALGILKYGKLLNSNKLYDFLNTFSYHTSGVRASVDRLFTLGSVRC